MQTAARPAHADDLPVVIALNDVALDEMSEKRGGPMWRRREGPTPPADQRLRSELDDTDALLAVGTIDDTVVGYAVVRRVALHDEGAVGDITDLFVLPDARGVGVGEALMELASQWCADQGCLGIDSVALPGDRATKNFFETFGLVARALRVHRSL